MTKDKAYEVAKSLGERAGHDETVLIRGKVLGLWLSVDGGSGSPADKINIEVDSRSDLIRVQLDLAELDVETAERIIDLVKERDAAVRLGAEVAEKAVAAAGSGPSPEATHLAKATLTPIPPGGDAGPRMAVSTVNKVRSQEKRRE